MTDQSEGSDSKISQAAEPTSAGDGESALPSLDSLDEKSDFSMFLSPGVSAELRKRALRKLFHSPLLAHRDGLDDYDDDYRSFKPLGDTVTAHARHQMERLTRDSGSADADEAKGMEKEGSVSVSEPPAPPPGPSLQGGEQHSVDRGPTATAVTFRSRGHLVIIGEQNRAHEMAAQLAGRLPCTLIVPSPAETGDPGTDEKLRTTEVVRVLRGTSVEVTGYLGMFEVTFCDAGGGVHSEQRRLEPCDLVLDLSTPLLLRHELLPPGYFAPGEDPQALQRALEELPDLVGEFEKPRFVHYDPCRCAHGNTRARGCRKCLEVCPAGAISPGQRAIEINHHLCQGCLICATA